MESLEDDEKTKNSKILLKERYDLLNWTSNVEMRTPNLLIPVQIANYVESLPFCKMAVSPKCDRLALMSYSRLLDIYAMTGEILEHESSVQVLEETCPEYCCLQFSASGTLLLSSRSTPHIDVFDNMGAHCYDIPLEIHEGIFDVNTAICGMQTVPNHSPSSNDKFLEILYVLQYSGTFSAFKIGRLSKYVRMWSVQLDIGQTGSFVVLPHYNLLLVASHYTESASVSPPAGLCSFRMMDTEPHVEPIRISTPDGGWMSRLPFSTSFMSYLPKMTLSYDNQLIVSVATSGSLYIFEIPSTHVRFSFNYISGPKPMEACFVDSEEIAIIYDTGVLLRCTLEDIEEKMHSMKIRSRKLEDEKDANEKDIYSAHTVLLAPAQREIFLLSAEGDSSVLREAAHKRVQLAGQLWFYTLWNSFKKLVGMAMGESAEPLQMATHMSRFEFSLTHSPTRTLQELFERTLVEHNYVRARELANEYDTIDIDVVLKSEWMNKCEKNSISVEDVHEILGQIRDTEWVAERSVHVETDDFEVQKAAITLGLKLENISVIWKIRLLHHFRLLDVCRINGDIEVYLRVRNQSCLDAAVMFAQNGDMESLLRLVEANLDVLKYHQWRILSSMPSCIYPTKYEHFLPRRNADGTVIAWELEATEERVLEQLMEIEKNHPDAANLVRMVNEGDVKREEPFVERFIEWIHDAVKRIDFECGMANNCVSLIQIAIERGFPVHDLLPKWTLYAEYIAISGSVSESIVSFEECSIKSFVERFSKLLEAELVKNASSIISLIEWKVKNKEEQMEDDERENALSEALTSLMTLTNERSTKVLVGFRNVRPDLIDDKVILDVLLNMTSTGADLLQSLGDLPVDKYAKVTSSLGSLMSRGVKMTFKSIFESMREADGARRVLIKLSRSGHCETAEEWAALRDDIMEMAEGIYGDLISRDEALELVAKEILEETRCTPEVMGLVLTMANGVVESPGRLNSKKSAEVLLAKSDDLMSEATHKDDPLLGRARFFAIAARPISANEAKEKLRWLDAIELAQELGCTMMPIAIKLSDHDTLLHQLVHIGTNYKQGKKIAKLAVLLEIDTPVATALSYCALAALNVNDATYLSRYIGEVISKARSLPVVHQLCMRIMKSEHVPTDMEDIYSCAMLNCTEENLLSTVDAIAESEKRLQAMRRTMDVDIDRIAPIFDTFVMDPMYTSLDHYVPSKIQEPERIEEAKKRGRNLCAAQMKRLMAYESSSLAMCYSLWDGDDEATSWTENEKLRRYQQSLRMFEDKLSMKILVRVPPGNLVKAAFSDGQQLTAEDRIEDYGCDKTRFLNEKEYREDAIVGLAMTEIEQQFEDAIELAKKYGIDEWQLHMTSLENAIVSLPIAEAKRILKSRGHLAKLRADGRSGDFHVALRQSVLPLLATNEQFVAYTSLFAETEPEKRAAPVIKKILEKRRDVKAVKMWNDVAYLANVIVSIPDKVLWSVIDLILVIPIGRKSCESAARTLLDGTDIRPPGHPLTLYMLLGKDIEEFLELVAVKPRDSEIEYLERAAILLDGTPTSPADLRKAVVERVATMRRSATRSPTENGVGGHQQQSANYSPPPTTMVQRRRN